MRFRSGKDTIDWSLVEKLHDEIGKIRALLLREPNELYDASSYQQRRSTTGGCNYRCVYCTNHVNPDDDAPFSEFLKVDAAFNVFGMKKVHHTGGEPTTRPNFAEYVRALSYLGYSDQIVTTNGSNPTVIGRAIDNGLGRVTVSLDTMDPEKFAQIARGDAKLLQRVLESVEVAVSMLDVVKINFVATRDSIQELDRVLEFAQKKRAILRLIELIPHSSEIKTGRYIYDEKHVLPEEMLERLSRHGELLETPIAGVNAAATYYRVGSLATPIAVIGQKWKGEGINCQEDKCVRFRINPRNSVSLCRHSPAIQGAVLAKLDTLEIAYELRELICLKRQRMQLSRYPLIHPFTYEANRFGLEESNMSLTEGVSLKSLLEGGRALRVQAERDACFPRPLIGNEQQVWNDCEKNYVGGGRTKMSHKIAIVGKSGSGKSFKKQRKNN